MKPTPRLGEPGWECPHCNAVREAPMYNVHSPNCLHCGARFYDRVMQRDGKVTEKTMGEWTRWGWTKEQIKTAVLKRQFVRPLESKK